MRIKKDLLRLFVISLFISVIAVKAYADRVVYSYDASGNRIQSQKQIRLRDAENGSDQDTIPLRESLSSHRITIYPNPYGNNTIFLNLGHGIGDEFANV